MSQVALDRRPPVAFQFVVSFDGTLKDPEGAFHEVSGIGTEMELETVVEGGENSFVHQLPKGVKHTRLALRRGVASQRSRLTAWCRSTLENGLQKRIEPRDVRVFLLDEEGRPLRGWLFANAYPVKWSVDGFDAAQNKMAIEAIELAYTTSTKFG
jgi:phage tail-like protein